MDILPNKIYKWPTDTKKDAQHPQIIRKTKIKNKTTIQSSDLTSGYFCKEKENTNWKIYMGTAIFNAALFAIAKVQKQSECPLIDE